MQKIHFFLLLFTAYCLLPTSSKAFFPPVADFVASEVIIGVGDSINFTDLSSNGGFPITNWFWVFSGGSPGTSTDQNPANIKYNTPGRFDVLLLATNAFGTGNLTKIKYCFYCF